METFIFDIMLNGRFICTLKYKYCALFPIDFEDLEKFILSKKPSLKGKDFRIAFQIWQDLKKARSTMQLMPSRGIALGVALIKMVAPQIYLFLVGKDLFTKRLKKVTMKELKVGERVTLEVTETDKESCKGCFFDSKMFYCEAWRKYPCSIKIRSDHKSVIFKEVKE